MFKLFAKKSLGQNFLVNQGVVERIIDAAELTSNETVLEVGPGTGALSHTLAEGAGKLVVVEKDRRAVELLKSELPSTVSIIEKDVLEFNPTEVGVGVGEYKVIANLPYYITSHFLRLMLEEWPAPKLAVLMVQKEVAQRMMAKPPDMNLLALSVQYFMNPEIIMTVSPGSFRPMPSVDSAVIRLVPYDADRSNTQELFKIIKAGFSSKRKTLLNNLSSLCSKEIILEALRHLQIREDARAETLSLSQWQNLIPLLKK